jgi:two-component system, cell cycle sensor histidine kinase and response regulator CckA
MLLIVDDSKTLRERLVTALAEIEGVAVLGEARNASEALAAVRDLKPKVVILDIQMPDGNGIEVLKTIKQESQPPVVIMLTNHPFPQYREKCRQLGADYFLDKTNDLETLIDIFKGLIARFKAEEKLHESEEQYRVVAETATDVIVTIDENSTILYVNKSVERVFGYSVPELLGQPIMLLMPDYLREIHKAAIIRYTQTGQKHINWESVELPGLHKNGQEIPLELSFGEFIKHGKRYFTGIARDISERKQVEQELRKSEERYRDLVENARDIIYSHDLQGNYTSINKAGERITGYTREEALQMNLAQTVVPEYQEKARQMIAKKLANEEVTIYDLEIIAKDGHQVAVEVNTRLVLQDGVPVGVQGIARDITERKQLEEQLRQAQKMEAIGRLAGGIAHDFNNLLTVITGYSNLLLKMSSADSLRPSLEEIKKASDRAATLTGQLLAFSRRQVLQPKILSLNAVIREMENMLQCLIGEDIQLRMELQPELANIKADPGQIEQVVMNLAVNARDAMPQGGKLTIETGYVHLTEEYIQQHIAVRPGHYIMLGVSDTGTGMDEQIQKRIFEPFFTTKAVGKGTGLGLSTVYGIVTQSGGHIWVYSEVGQGTTFKIYLPCVVESAPAYKRSAEREEVKRGTETILLAEDEEMVRKLAREVLERYGYRVIEAANGTAALALCEQMQEPIHLLVSDVVMPELGGRELAQRLAPLHPQMKVLYMSGYTDNAIVHHGILNSDLSFIQKPFTPEALAHKVREVLTAKS